MHNSAEIVWILEGRSPDQLPLARLAEYMQQFAALLGDDKDIHFARIEEGSTRLVAKPVSGQAARRSQARVYAVRDRRASADAMRAASRINEMVGEDGRHARITFGASAILRFSGNMVDPARPVTLVDTATITGRLYALLEAPSGQLKARIRPRNAAAYVECTADASVGRELRQFFLDAVRVQGRGTWFRSDAGKWSCQSLHILKVSGVKDVSLRQAINDLRSIQTDWPEDPLGDWDALNEQGGAA